MFSVIRKVYALFSPAERRRFAWLLVAIIVMALVEVAGVASIMPFIAIVANPDVIERHSVLGRLYQAFGFQSPLHFLIAAGLGTLTMIIVANTVSTLTNWSLLRFTHLHGHALSEKLLAKYLDQPYVFFLNRNTAELSKNILNEVTRVVVGVLIPGLQLIAKLTVAMLMVSLLIAVDPGLALGVAATMAFAYSGIYLVVRRRLNVVGGEATAAAALKFKIASEALGGIKEIKIAGREKQFIRRFAEPSLTQATRAATGEAITLLPRYALEAVAFGGILLITIYLITTRHDTSAVIPVVALYAFAGYRMMPALQQIYAGVTMIRYHASALDLLCEDLGRGAPTLTSIPPSAALLFSREVAVRDLTFAYPGSDEPTLRNLSLAIRANTTVALTGPSGAGKTTLVDVLLGLLQPTRGMLMVDGVGVTEENVRAWQKNIGYVPQNIYLTDDTVAANIALGVPVEEIDRAAVEKAAKIANLHDFVVSALPHGFDTVIGEHGIRLSGGQRQRIGIARALYSDPPVLILDEATSALDGITESAIMEAIHRLAHKKTIIIIAHRLSTVQECDVIYVLDGGHIVAMGSYDELMRNSPQFRGMAKAKVSEGLS